MSHPSRLVHCTGPQDPHALHGIAVQTRRGDLDARCPVCAGHGQWNRELDLASQRSKRQNCDTCEGRGWIETGSDPIATHDVILSPDGQPQWVVRLDSSDGEG
jgi:hypothetical protein